MSKRTYGSQYGFQTRAVHTGNDVGGETKAIKRPIGAVDKMEFLKQ